MEPYRTLAAPMVVEIPKIKGSRFIASAAPVATDDEALAHVAAVKRLHHSARHVCWARRLGADGSNTRSRDAGEPSGSAGKPILSAILGRDLTFVVVAVTRYFGGTKLGVGGLVRAYGGAAAEALGRAEIRHVVPTRRATVDVDYAQLEVVRAFAAREGYAEASAEYGARVRVVWLIPDALAQSFSDLLFDLTGGRVRAIVDATGEP
jgi:uncharacterized YigZ family protein